MEPNLIESATRRSFARRVYLIRMLCGGILAGGFLGICLGSAIELCGNLLLDWTSHWSGIALIGAGAAVIGGTWGLILGLTDAGDRRN